jgi:valyl-tRNA synthetase
VAARVFAKSETLAVIGHQKAAVEKLAIVTLDLLEGAAPKGIGAVSSTPQFDLVLEIPAAMLGVLQAGIQKEKEQLEKVIANQERQLTDETFLSKAPAKVIDGMRAKLAEYKAQLKKLNDRDLASTPV